MAKQDTKHKFFALIPPDSDYNFVGRSRLFIGISIFLMVGSILMLPINHFWRGSALNFSIDFRGGTEIQAVFSKQVTAADVREAMEKGGFPGADVVSMKSQSDQPTFLLRFGAVSPLSKEKSADLEKRLRDKFGAEALRKFEFSEGGDKVYLRFTKAVEQTDIVEVLKEAGVENNAVQRYGRPEDNTYEIILVGLDVEVKKALESKLGAGAVASMPSVESVGAKAGKELRDNGLKSLLFVIICIMIYVAIRFDFRYGPAVVVALLHDAIVVVGAMALTYKEFSLTTIAAILTVVGYSVNDTIVVFDRMRENAARLRDKRFDRMVNISINETLSRTVFTSATTFFVTLAMNVFGTGVIKDFAFALNVGILVGTYSSIFVAAPLVIWLNNRYFKQSAKGDKKGQGSKKNASV